MSEKITIPARMNGLVEKILVGPKSANGLVDEVSVVAQRTLDEGEKSFSAEESVLPAESKEIGALDIASRLAFDALR